MWFCRRRWRETESAERDDFLGFLLGEKKGKWKEFFFFLGEYVKANGYITNVTDFFPVCVFFFFQLFFY